MSDDPCSLACQTKIIINGGNAARLIETQCEAFQFFFAQGGVLRNGSAVIKILNQLEDLAVGLQKLALKEVGYTGAVGKMLQ